jgi:hypothetical protein
MPTGAPLTFTLGLSFFRIGAYMTKEQLDVIVGLLAGMQTAIVHISKIVASETNISPNDIAKSFETLAGSIPA